MDQVTISIRLISVQTGEILVSLSSSKTIASYKSGIDVFKFLDMGTKALEIEQGAAVNEPVNYATRTAIEFGVLELIKEGERKGLWKTKKTNKEESKEKINEIESFFLSAYQYSQTTNATFNARLHAMKGLFKGQLNLYIHTSEAKAIISSINFFQQKFPTIKLVLVGASEAYQVIDFLKNKNIFKYKNSDELIIELKNECLNAKSIQEQEEELKQFLNEEKSC